MKLLREFQNIYDAEHLSKRLRNKGVMTFISSKRSHNLHRHRTGATKVGVWAVLPHQYEDAFILLSNKKHKLEDPLSLEEMQQLEEQTTAEFSRTINRTLETFITRALAFGLICIVSYVCYRVLINA